MNDLELALAAAGRGAELIRNSLGSHRITEQKGRVNPVTEIDRASEDAIVGMISEHRPDDGFLAEEGSNRESTGRRWIIDPLDGTVNFVHGIPQVAVSVALYDGDEPLVGVVMEAIHGEIFAAERGKGATQNGEPIQVSGVTEMHQSLVVTGFPYDRDRYGKVYAGVVGEVLEKVNGIRRTGTAALDLCWVACGRFEGYWEFALGPWDAAAGVLVATEAGATVTDGRGGPWTIHSRHCIAATPGIHTAFRDIIAPLIPEHLEGGGV